MTLLYLLMTPGVLALAVIAAGLVHGEIKPQF